MVPRWNVIEACLKYTAGLEAPIQLILDGLHTRRDKQVQSLHWIAYFLTPASPDGPSRRLSRDQTELVYDFIDQYILSDQQSQARKDWVSFNTRSNEFAVTHLRLWENWRDSELYWLYMSQFTSGKHRKLLLNTY